MAKKGDKVWIIHGHSESGDHYMAAFSEAPTEVQLAGLYHDWDGHEDKTGPGHYGSYIHGSVEESELL